MAFRDDLVDDRGIERAVHVFRQQPPGLIVVQPADGQGGQARQHRALDTGAARADQRDLLGQQPASHESDDLRRGLVEPERVVDQAGQRGRASAAWAISVKVPRPTRNRSGTGPSLSPNTVASASRCGGGNCARWSSRGAQS